MTESTGSVVTRQLALWLEQRGRERPLVVGITGAQGSGKSSLARDLEQRLGARGFGCAGLSLDDFYLTQAERQELSRSVHPLFRTRGVPGTHDVAWLSAVLSDLRASNGALVPRFDKATDERAPEGTWLRVPQGPLDVILVEGWCLALPPEASAELEAPINELERSRDAEGKWRRAVNAALGTTYRDLFAEFDYVVALIAPCFEVVLEWRAQQEQALAFEPRVQQPEGLLRTRAALRDFVAHFERLTRLGLRELPRRADLAIFLDDERRPIETISA